MNLLTAIVGYLCWLLVDLILGYWMLEAHVEQDRKGFRRTLIVFVIFNAFVGFWWWMQ